MRGDPVQQAAKRVVELAGARGRGPAARPPGEGRVAAGGQYRGQQRLGRRLKLLVGSQPGALTLGFQYLARAAIGDGSTAGIHHLDLCGQPGTRLPHRWLPGRHRSTLDLAGRGMTLIIGTDGKAWADAAAALGEPGLGVGQVDLADWGAAVGTGNGGALLVRPDQVVAWRHRGPAADPRAELGAALGRLLSQASPR